MVRSGERSAARSSRSARIRVRVIAGLVAAISGVTAGVALLGAGDGPDAATAAATPSPLEGHVFRTVSVEQDGQTMALFDSTPVWLSIGRGSFGMYADCNRIWGPLRVTASLLHVSEIGQTAMGCAPAEREQRDDVLRAFLAGKPSWQLDGDRLVLTLGPTTIALQRDDLPPPLPRPNPARRKDLIDAVLGTSDYRTWPWGLGATWGGVLVKVDVAARGRRTVLTMRTQCRGLEAPVTIRRDTLTVGAPRRKALPCRSGYAADSVLSSVRPFFRGKVMWHLDRRRLTLQRDRSTLSLRVR